jgi:F0F1-type ATP synthase membrane subunit b/b'
LVFASVTLIGLFELVFEGDAPWWNYPGLELWKFLNLIVLIVGAKILLGRRIREGFRSRRETIKQELTQARQERDAAVAKLAEIESRFAGLDAEMAAIREKAKAEAEAERIRLAQATEQEVGRIRDQAKREIDSAAKTARHDLRRFAAQESVRLAETILKQEIKSDDDARLAKENVQELGRLQA